MTGLALVGHQFRYDQKAFWRNPASVFFTVMFPVILLLIFGTIFGSQNVEIRGGEIDTDAYYVPAIISLSIISATMQSLAMSLVIAREDGRLKRSRGTIETICSFTAFSLAVCTDPISNIKLLLQDQVSEMRRAKQPPRCAQLQRLRVRDLKTLG